VLVTISDQTYGEVAAARAWRSGALVAALISMTACAKSEGTVWNGIPVCATASLIDGMLFLDARGQVRQFNHRQKIDGFYMGPDDVARISADFDPRTNLLDRIEIDGGHEVTEALKRLTEQLGPPASIKSIVAGGTQNPSGASMRINSTRVTTWKTRSSEISLSVPNDGSQYTLRYDGKCSGSNGIGL
jgi:hypothetical protein